MRWLESSKPIQNYTETDYTHNICTLGIKLTKNNHKNKNCEFNTYENKMKMITNCVKKTLSR